MSTTIMDGAGQGYRASVGSDNRLKVDSVSEDAFVHAAENGRAFNVNTKEITLSGTAPWTKPALYLKNEGTDVLECVGWFIGEKTRSGGNTTLPLLFEMYGNPLSVSGGTAVNFVNRKIGDSRTFETVGYSYTDGGSGVLTATAPTGDPLLYQYHYSGRSFGTVNFSLPPGQSIAIFVTSQADSVTFYTGFTGYIEG